MVMYILNTSIVPNPGLYDYRVINLKIARDLVSRLYFESAIGHAATASLLSRLLGREIETKRRTIGMQAGDTALVFRPVFRLEEGKVLSEVELNELVAQDKFEFGLLICITE